MTGLYALKPWFGRRLASPVETLTRYDVSPDAVTAAGVAAAAAAAGLLATGVTGAAPVAAVATLLVLRLACANVDGQLARRLGRTGLAARRGALVNEVGDRVADLLPLLGLAIAGAPHLAVALAAIGASAPSWVSLAARSAGLPERLQTGPLGKTERCLAVAVAASSPDLHVPICVVLGVGGLVTAMLRLRQAWR